MLRFVFLLVASLTLLVTGFAQAQERVLSVILDSNSTALGDSVINAVFCAPAIEGDYVAFRTNNKTSGIADGIWAYHIPSKSFTKLVGIGTPVPGGTGTFQNFNTAGSSLGGPVLKDGVVVFGGVDQGTNPNGFAPVGVYSVPVTGGAITKIASFQDAAPGTPTNFFNFGEDSRNFGSISQSNGVVVFEGTFGGGPIGGTGLYNAPIDGGMIKSVGDSDHPWNPLELFPVKNFLNPATNGTGVALIGGTVFGYFGLFYSALPSTGAENFSLLVGPETALPGSSGAAGDTKLFAPSTQMDGTRIGFIGRDESANLIGVFVTNPSGSSFETIVTNKMNLAGISTFPDSSINPFSFAMDGTNTLFLVYSGHNDQSLFLKTSSGIERVADPSLTLNGIPLYDFSEVTPYALDGERFVFAYSTITFPRSVLVLAGPPSDFPGDDPESSVQQLVADAQSQLVQAKKKLPKGKKKKDVRQSIRDARSSIQEIVDSLFGIFDSSEVAVLNLTQKRLKQLRTLSKKGSRAKATDQVRKRSWKKVGKLLKALL